jgi:hypothetical protein
MHAAYEPIRLEDEMTARGRLQRSRVIEKSQSRRMFRQRAEIARDQAFFAG